MQILIVTRPADGHSAAVDWALRKGGMDPVVWMAEAFPSHQSLSFLLAGDAASAPSIRAREDDLLWEGWPFDTVWLRRLSAPRLEGQISEIDRPFAEEESWTALRSIMAAFQDRGRWINPLLAKERSLYKLAQLAAAVSSGLAVPETLATNDKQELLEFMDRLKGAVVAKQFAPMEWVTASGRAKSRTCLVTPGHVERWRPRELAPTIFQRAIAKAFEVRITAMGETLVGARLDVEGAGPARVDWRLCGPAGQHLRVQSWTVPERVRDGILRLMQRLGLAFGCVDGIVTPEGEFVFLEVNEMGQFLWLDEHCPELSLLGRFCSFLAYGDCEASREFPDSAGYERSGHWPRYRRACERRYGKARGRYLASEVGP